MGAKDWMVFYAERDVPGVLREAPTLDREATQRLVQQLFADKDPTAIDDVSLATRIHLKTWFTQLSGRVRPWFVLAS